MLMAIAYEAIGRTGVGGGNVFGKAFCDSNSELWIYS